MMRCCSQKIFKCVMKVYLKRIHMLGLDFLYKRSLIRGLAILTFGLQQVFSSVWHFLVGLYLKIRSVTSEIFGTLKIITWWQTVCLTLLSIMFLTAIRLRYRGSTTDKSCEICFLVWNLIARWRYIKLWYLKSAGAAGAILPIFGAKIQNR